MLSPKLLLSSKTDADIDQLLYTIHFVAGCVVHLWDSLWAHGLHWFFQCSSNSFSL